MPSRALQFWQGPAQEVLGEVVHAHRQVGGTGPGRRHLTQQINYAYVTLLVGQFQAFARSLHSEAAAALCMGVSDPRLRFVVEGRMTDGRALDRGNPSPSNLGSDFGRFGREWWSEVNGMRAANAGRMRKLDALVAWRNAIVHGDILRKRQSGDLEPDRVDFRTCMAWHRALDQLVISFDVVLANQCVQLGAPRPW